MRAVFVATFAVTVALAPSLSARQQPSAEDLLKVSRAYLASYAPKVSGALLDERYTLTFVAGGRMESPHRINSDLVLINVGGTLVGIRDAYSIGGAKIREAKPRVAEMLAEPTQAKWDQVQEIARASFKYFLAESVVRFNDPMLVFRFLNPKDPSKFSYSIEGKKKINGVETIGLRFQENRADGVKYTLNTRGNASVSGRFWVDPATGAIHQTDLSIDSKTENSRITVSYAPAQGFEFLLPSKTIETYEERDDAGSGLGSSGAATKFEANASYGNPRYSPIDFTRGR
jgi:hypothetical protein